MNDQQRAAMQMALDALNAMLTHMGMDEDAWNKPTFDQAREAIIALREALAQPQEPVLITRIAVPESNVRVAQPQGEWVDLTDDEVEAVAKSNDTWQLFQSLRIFDFSNALMAKFKEKNTPPVVPQGEPVANPVCYLWVDPTTMNYIVDRCDHPTEELIPVYTTPPVVPQEPVGCMVKGRLLSYKDNAIPNDCLLYLSPPSVAEWEKLRDPVALHKNLLRGLPAQLTPDMLKHLLGNEFDKAIEAAIAEAYDKGCADGRDITKAQVEAAHSFNENCECVVCMNHYTNMSKAVAEAIEATKEKAIAALQGVATGRLDVVEAIRSMK